MKPRVSSLLVGIWAVAMIALLPRGSVAQGGGGGGGGGGGAQETPTPAPDEGGGAPPLVCENDGSSAHYEEFLQGEGSITVRVAATETGCPNHVNWPFNPGFTVGSPTNTSIPAYPMLIANGGTTDLSRASGEIGIMRNGVAMYSAWANDPVETYEDTAFYQTSNGFDPCGGHASPSGQYHYHNTAGCLQEQAGGVVGEHSPLIGWAYDGFPFYGQLGPGGVEMKMCGADGADATHCLDLCSGYEAFIDEDTFAYRYYTSCGYDESFFPFTANCFRGCCPTGVTCDDEVEACGEGAEIGYSEDHVPVASEPLHELYDTTLIEGIDTDLVNSEVNVNCSLYLGSASIGQNPDSDISGASGSLVYARVALSAVLAAGAAAALSL